MTMRLMDQFGHTPELERDPDTGEPRRIVVPRVDDASFYRGTPYLIEPDASNASYFLAAAALHPGCRITVEGLGRYSLQGDVAIADYLQEMGAEVKWGKDQVTVTGTDTLEGVELDLTGTPDLAQTLAVTAVFASSPTTLRGLHTLRVKETDRVAALEKELSKLGSRVEVMEEGADVGLRVWPADRPKAASIDTYDDHRMAMAFALAASKTPGVVIRDAGCCSKTYPEFFEDFRRAVGV
jgi:3-phosphoshikimate 1-carboxyvinyltransferase